MHLYGIIVLLFVGFKFSTANVFQRSTGVCECRSLWWVRAKSVADIPPNAVFAGISYKGGNQYVGRTFYKEELVPGKVLDKNGLLHIPYYGKEYHKSDFEVLASSAPTRWVYPTEHRVPPGAAFGGYSIVNHKVNFYICRVSHNGYWVPGKLNRDTFLCYYPRDGKEMKSSNFQVLVLP